MKIGDLIWLEYESSQYIVKIKKINKHNKNFKFNIGGKVIWSSTNASLNVGFDNADGCEDNYGGFNDFINYSVYDKNIKIKEIIMLEQL